MTEDLERAVLVLARQVEGVRAELAQLNQNLSDGVDAPEPAFVCRCGYEALSDEAAQAHAVQVHGAPLQDWRELMRDEA